MVNQVLLLPIGMVLGFLAGLGIGGGTLLMLWLTLIMNTPSITARAINLMFFLAAAGGACLYRMKKGNIKISTILPAVISGCIAAGICGYASTLIHQDMLRKVFGILLMITGFRELFYRPRKAR